MVKNEASLSTGKQSKLKNSLSKIRNYLFGKYSRQKFAIGSFLIIALLGVISIRALATSDHLIAWAPDNTTFYLHIKKDNAGPIWQKIKNIKLFEESEHALSELIPAKANEISILGQAESFAVLFNSNEAPNLNTEALEKRELESGVYLISRPGFPVLEKDPIVTVTKQHGLGPESLSADGYLFIDQYYDTPYLPGPIKSWQTKLDSAVSAWSITIKDGTILWESMLPKNSNNSIELLNKFIPQNTTFWTHGEDWQNAWQNSLASLPADPLAIKIASQKLWQAVHSANAPEKTFTPLFSGPYDLFISHSSDQQFWTLALEKKSNENPLWLNNFEAFWQKNLCSTVPVYSTIILPDGSRAVEMSSSKAFSWQDQNIDNKTIRWLQGPDKEFVIGYIEVENMLIISNYYANLVDFLYLDDQKGWIDLAKISQKCAINQQNLLSYHNYNNNSAKLSEIISIIGPFIVQTNNNICHF